VRTLLASAVAAPWVAWALVRTMGAEAGYPLVAVIAFTPYAALTSPVPVLAGLALRRRVVAAVAAVAALALVLAMVPRAVAGPQPDAEGPRLVVMTMNLWLGRADADHVLEVARQHDVDVLAVQELRPPLMERLDEAGALEQFPARAVDPQRGAAGSGVLSRRPLRVVGGTPAGFHAQPEVEIEVPGAPPVRVKTVHPNPPISPDAERTWRAAMRALPRADGRVRVLAGDFNATLDHDEMRALLDSGYVDAADAAGAGLRPTWPARPRARGALPLTIDHVLVDRRVRVERVTIVRVRRSDHRAVIAVLRLPRA
jgi:endonuclease/exonuclease/phosphatase family metal-dependent hydrolase